MKFFFILFSFSLCLPAEAQKSVQVSDFTVNYNVSQTANSNNEQLKNAGKILYVKGKMARADFASNQFKQTIFYDNLTGTAVILKELGAGKYMTRFTANQWKLENKRYEEMIIKFSEDKKTIIGYECKKAMILLKDGSSFSLYYTSSVIPSTTENPFQFKDIPGLVLEFETSSESKSPKITYTATSINLSPVPASKFDIPASGYRSLQPENR